MRVLLVSPCYPHRRQRYEAGPASGLLGPPLGLGYIAAVLESRGSEVAVVDMLIDDLRPQDLDASLRALRPEVVGISCNMAFVSLPVLEIAQRVADLLPEAVVVLGGNHATYEAERILREVHSVDWVIRFEGEDSMAELVAALQAGGSPLGLMGVSGRDGAGAVLHGPDRARIDPLDRLPLPARHLLAMEHYAAEVRGLVSASRGCPFSCAYCSTAPFNGRYIRVFSIERVVDELEVLVAGYGVRHVMFVDDTFTASRARVLALCAETRRRGLPITWACDTRVDLVDRHLLEVMRKAGCTSIFYGIESAYDVALKRVRKGFTVEQAIAACRATRAAGIQVQESFVVGLPGDTPSSVQAIGEFVMATSPDRVLLNFFAVYPGTAVSADPRAFGVQWCSREWHRYERTSPMASTDDMCPDDIRRAYVELVTALHDEGETQPIGG